MSLRQFEYALAVAAEGSVTAAAERLHVAQPSMSQQIRALERELGVQLFSRTPSGLVPTVVGRSFLREAQTAVDAARRARTTARKGAEDLVGELVVAAQLGLGARQLPGAVNALRRLYPRLEVTILEEPDLLELDRMARQGLLDLALMPAPCDEGLYEGHHLGDEEFVVVLPEGHRLLEESRVDVRLLADESWVRFAAGSALDTVLTDVLAGVLSDRDITPSTVARVSQAATAARWAAGGLGPTLVPASSVPAEQQTFARPLSPAVSQPVVAAVRPGAGPAEAALLDLLRQQVWPTTADPEPRAVAATR